VLEELQPGASVLERSAFATSSSANTDPLLDAMGHDLVSLDALVARTGWPAQELNVRLLELELSGQIARRPGQLFQRVTLA